MSAEWIDEEEDWDEPEWSLKKPSRLGLLWFAVINWRCFWWGRQGGKHLSPPDP